MRNFCCYKVLTIYYALVNFFGPYIRYNEIVRQSESCVCFCLSIGFSSDNVKVVGRNEMISTVTTSTVAIVTTTAMAGSLALISILTLLVLLVQREMTVISEERFARVMGQALKVGIVPLLIAFVLIVVVRVVEVLK